MTPTLVCIGAGYSAKAVAGWALSEGWRVVGTSRTEDGRARLGRAGLETVLFDGVSVSTELGSAIADATHILVSIPPDVRDGDPSLSLHVADIAAAGSLAWVGYLSTVGVYGDHGGGWVDETTQPMPVSNRSIARLSAEDAWRSIAEAAPWRLQIFRLAGIYGPGRSPIDRVRRGTAQVIVKPGQVFNRIHVDDIRAAVVAGMAGRGTHDIYNVTDDEPAPPQDVVRHAAELVGAPLPTPVPFEAAELSPMAASFYGENKRVRNTRLKTDLGVTLAYPTYREGLAALR